MHADTVRERPPGRVPRLEHQRALVLAEERQIVHGRGAAVGSRDRSRQAGEVPGEPLQRCEVEEGGGPVELDGAVADNDGELGLRVLEVAPGILGLDHHDNLGRADGRPSLGERDARALRNRSDRVTTGNVELEVDAYAAVRDAPERELGLPAETMQPYSDDGNRSGPISTQMCREVGARGDGLRHGPRRARSIGRQVKQRRTAIPHESGEF